MRPECEKIVSAAADLPAADIRRIVKELTEIRNRSADYADAVRARAAQAEADVGLARAKKIQAVESARAFEELAPRVEEIARKDPKNAHLGVTSVLVGLERNYKSVRDSVEAWVNEREFRVKQRLISDLGPSYHRLQDDAFADRVARELGGIDTGFEDAKRAAQVIRDAREALRVALNEKGAHIGKIEDYIFAQSHDPWAIEKAGFERWRSVIDPLIDPETFGGSDPETFLKEVFLDIVSGRHDRIDVVDARGAGSNLLDKASKHRILKFKDADAFLSYNKQFGKMRSPGLAMVRQIDHMSRTLGLVEKLGPNPEFTVQRLWDAAGRVAREDGRALRRRDVVFGIYKALVGADNAGANSRLARWSQFIRNLQSLTSLGMVMLRSIPDLGTSSASLTYHGEGYLSGMAELFRQFSKSLSKESRIETFKLIAFHMESLRGDIVGRWNVGDGPPGFTSALVNKLFRLNFLEQWTDAMKAAYARTLTHVMARDADLPFEALRNRAVLESYGITADDWNLIRNARAHLGDTEVLSPEKIADDEVASKFRRMLISETDRAVVTAGARERGSILFGHPADSVVGQWLRFMAQFRMFTLASVFRVFPRVQQGGIPAALKYALTATLLGYASNSAVNLLEGKEPDDPTRPTTWGAALLTGGGGFFIGELMLHKFNNAYGNFSTFALGPVGSTLNDLSAVYSLAFQGNTQKAERKLASAVRYHALPFGNLPYTKAGVDYLWNHLIAEQLNPGYLERVKQRAAKEGRPYYIGP